MYYGQFTLTTKKSLHIIFNGQFSHLFAQFSSVPNTQTTLCSTSVAIGCICALHAGDVA